MRKTTSLLIATALAGTLGLAAFAPVSIARGWNNSGQQQGQMGQRGGQRGGQMQGQMASGGGMLQFVCNSSAAAQFETVLTNLGTRLAPSKEQAILFDDFKAAVLAAQTEYADSCVQPMIGQTRDFIALMFARQSNLAAQLAAYETVTPKIEALFETLTDAQKASIVPTRPGAFGQYTGQPQYPGQPAQFQGQWGQGYNNNKGQQGQMGQRGGQRGGQMQGQFQGSFQGRAMMGHPTNFGPDTRGGYWTYVTPGTVPPAPPAGN